MACAGSVRVRGTHRRWRRGRVGSGADRGAGNVCARPPAGDGLQPSHRARGVAVTAGTAEPGPGRELSAFDLGCVVVGGIIGVGIFFTPGTVARRVASTGEVMTAWATGGALAVLGAFVFAELSARLPGHGGIFRYIHAAFGRLPAFVYGWANWLVIQSGAMAVVALICVDHIERAVFGASTSAPHVRVLFGAWLILLLTGTNLLGLRVGKRVQNLLTVTKVLALCLLVAVAMFAAGAGEAASAAPPGMPEHGLERFAGAMLPVLFAIGGWQQGSFVAGAAPAPQRDVPVRLLGRAPVVVAGVSGHRVRA